MLLQAAPVMSIGIVSAVFNSVSCQMDEEAGSCCSSTDRSTEDDNQCCGDECGCIAISTTTGLTSSLQSPIHNEEGHFTDSNFHYAQPTGKTCQHDLFQPPQR